MSYATPTDFTAYGLPTAALDGFSGDVQDYLDAASAQMDTYLRGRHTLPMVSPPLELVRAECVIAAYDLLSVRGFDPEEPADKNVLIRYEKTFKWLRMIAEGVINLAVDADSTPGVNDGGPIVASKPRADTTRFR
jgi:phage gp36-like protein